MNVRLSWRFDVDELGVLRQLLQIGQWPFPLGVRPVAAMRDEQRARDRAASDRLTAGGVVRSGRVDVDLENTLLALLRPEIGLDALGYAGERSGSIVRVLAGSRGPAGAVAVQLPGPDDQVGGDLVVRAVPPPELATALVSVLPAFPPGRQPAVQVALDDLRSPWSASVTRSVRPSPAELARERLTAMTEGPLDGTGQLSVSVERPGGPPLRRCTLRWLDRTGDGRYVVVSDGDVRVRPADPAVLAQELGAAVAAARRNG